MDYLLVEFLAPGAGTIEVSGEEMVAAREAGVDTQDAKAVFEWLFSQDAAVAQEAVDNFNDRGPVEVLGVDWA